MTAVHPEALLAPSVAPDGFEVGYTTEDGLKSRTPLAEAWAVPFEQGSPVRRFTSRKGQQHLSGLWWSATTGGHVGFESWLERDHVMLLGFDASVVGIASQPFWLRWRDVENGKPVAHVPDFLARRTDGSVVVIDCRPAERRPPRDVAKFETTARACANEASRGYHGDLPLVNTPTIQKVISTSRLLVQVNRNQVSARRGVIISGASGTGKTTALTQLGRTHERHTRKRHPGDRHQLPVLYVTVPPAATARMLAVEFARFLGLEFTGRANITDIVNAVCATAAHTRVELVCADDATSSPGGSPRSPAAHVSTWLGRCPKCATQHRTGRHGGTRHNPTAPAATPDTTAAP